MLKISRMWTLGGQQHANSDAVRDVQWNRAMEAMLNNPVGYGAGRSAEIAGKLNTSGVWVVDSNWINILVDFGVVGFAAFMGFFGLMAWYGIRDYLRRDDEASQLSGVFGMSIILYLLTMYTLSFVGNLYLPMAMAAGIAANRYRLSRLAPVETVRASPPMVGRGLAA